jgi:IS605 OrfB family transposase
VQRERNHRISQRLVDASPHRLIGLEELTHIRERAKRTHGKRASAKQRRANRHASQWAFAELQSSIAYQALLSNSKAVQVDA